MDHWWWNVNLFQLLVLRLNVLENEIIFIYVYTLFKYILKQMYNYISCKFTVMIYNENIQLTLL
jgi:hypothetical protein